jgi:hypothetical protein
MTTLAIKNEILKKLHQTNDESMLDIINKLLDKAALDPVLKKKLTNRALKAEEDIKSNKTFSKKEVLKKLKG